MKYTTVLLRVATLALLTAAVPAAAQQASLKTLVVLGDSEGAGYADNCLAKHSQIDSFGAIVARQAGVDFQQPLLDEPGIGGCLVLTSLAPSFTTKASVPKPLNFALPRPYNNLSIGGCAMGDLTKATTAANARPGACQNTIDLVLRNGPPVNLNLGSPVDQALALNPTFVIVEMIGNDLLGAVTAGDIRDGITVTPLAQYTTDLTNVITKLKTKVLNGMIFTTADVTNIPFATTIPPFLTKSGQLVLVGGAPVSLLGPKGCAAGVPACPIPANTLVTLNAAGYLPSGFGIPCAVAPLPNCDKPLPAAPLGPGAPGALIYASDVALLRQRAADYNTAIQSVAAANGYTVFDTNAFLASLKAGRDYGGVIISSSYLTGGAFSYDGFHVSSIGQAIAADEVIKFLNKNYALTIPEPDLSVYLFNGNSTGGIPSLAFLGPEGLERARAEIFSPEFRESLFNLMPPPAILRLGDQPVGDSGAILKGAPEPGDAARDRR